MRSFGSLPGDVEDPELRVVDVEVVGGGASGVLRGAVHVIGGL